MKNLRLRAAGAFLALAGASVLGGCGSLPEVRLPDMKYAQTRSFSDDDLKVYAASQVALEQLGYTFVRGSRADGKLEMRSRVHPGSALRARQRTAHVTVTALDAEGCDVRITVWEASEDESPAGTVTPTNRILREGSVYQVFWERLAEGLGLPPAAPQTGAP